MERLQGLLKEAQEALAKAEAASERGGQQGRGGNRGSRAAEPVKKPVSVIWWEAHQAVQVQLADLRREGPPEHSRKGRAKLAPLLEELRQQTEAKRLAEHPGERRQQQPQQQQRHQQLGRAGSLAPLELQQAQQSAQQRVSAAAAAGRDPRQGAWAGAGVLGDTEEERGRLVQAAEQAREAKLFADIALDLAQTAEQKGCEEAQQLWETKLESVRKMERAGRLRVFTDAEAVFTASTDPLIQATREARAAQGEATRTQGATKEALEEHISAEGRRLAAQQAQQAQPAGSPPVAERAPSARQAPSQSQPLPRQADPAPLQEADRVAGLDREGGALSRQVEALAEQVRKLTSQADRDRTDGRAKLEVEKARLTAMEAAHEIAMGRPERRVANLEGGVQRMAEGAKQQREEDLLARTALESRAETLERERELAAEEAKVLRGRLEEAEALLARQGEEMGRLQLLCEAGHRNTLKVLEGVAAVGRALEGRGAPEGAGGGTATPPVATATPPDKEVEGEKEGEGEREEGEAEPAPVVAATQPDVEIGRASSRERVSSPV